MTLVSCRQGGFSHMAIAALTKQEEETCIWFTFQVCAPSKSLCLIKGHVQPVMYVIYLGENPLRKLGWATAFSSDDQLPVCNSGHTIILPAE